MSRVEPGAGPPQGGRDPLGGSAAVTGGRGADIPLKFGSGKHRIKNGTQWKMISSRLTMIISSSSAQIVMIGIENEQSQAVADGRVKRLASQRQTLAAWRSVHVPLTWVLFATALIHSAAALYYVTLAR